ncbi:unnamed protein product [Prunus brigantina]
MVGSGSSGGDLRTPQFDGANYDFWAVKMETILIAHDLWDVVEVGHIPVEAPTISREDKIKNAKALSLIQGALTDELFPRIRNEKTAKGAWDVLRREFRGDKKLRAVKLQAVRADFEYMRMTDGESLDSYLARFFGTVNNLKSLGEDVTETRIVQKLLMSLSRRYKSIVSIIEETRDLDVLRVEEVIASVKVYDKREDLHDERDKVAGTERAFSSLKVGNNQVQGTHKGSREHKGKPRCGKCNRFGHIAKDCEGNKQVAKLCKGGRCNHRYHVLCLPLSKCEKWKCMVCGQCLQQSHDFSRVCVNKH